MTRILTALAVAVLLGGCGLISSDIADFELALQPKSFTVDTSGWGISADEGAFPRVACGANEAICADAAAAYCGQGECEGSCEQTTDTCTVTVGVTLSQPVNLVQENAELEALNSQPLVRVTIDAVEYMVEENTLSFDSPELLFYVAPLHVMTRESDEARLVGVIPPIPAGQQLGWSRMQLTPEGEAILRDFMGNYRSVFNVIVGAEVAIEGGAQSPSGSTRTWVRVRAHAGL